MLKKLIISSFALINKIWLMYISKGTSKLVGGSFFRVLYNVEKNNFVHIHNTDTSKTKIDIKGNGNSIFCHNSLISECQFSISGSNNTILIGKNVKLRKANIIIRGNGCTLEIGDRTTFGGIRIINVGSENKISIGQDCLFSDKIELWASDTHYIYNENDNLINQEKPVFIGNCVWVGSRVIILKGVTISDGSIIGMGALVTKNVPANSISVGNPNKIIKEKISWSLKAK